MRVTIDIPGITILDELGSGRQSIVFKGRRGELSCAVKVLRAKQEGFHREVAALARINDPAVPRIWEAGVSRNQPYIVMDLVDGDPLSTRLKMGPLEPSSAVAIIQELTRAIAEFHRLRIIHRDIKPQNILVTPSGQVKLIDFGFAAELREQSHDNLAGTLLYCSPEQCGFLKRPMDYRSDLYSLGCVLYECLTGVPPYRSANLGDLISMHGTSPIPSARETNPAVSRYLDQLIHKLLSKDPDDRYQSAKGLLSDLSRAFSSEQATLGKDDDLIGSHDAPMIGRQKELAELSERWAKSKTGAGSIALISGEPGGGKSRLARELLLKIRDSATLLLKGKCAQDNRASYEPLRQMIEDFLRRTERIPEPERSQKLLQLIQAADDFAPYLRRLSPLLARHLPAKKIQGESLSDVQDIFANSIAEFFLKFAEMNSGSGSVLMLLDDIQWLDDGSRQVLARIAKRIGSVPFFIVATARHDTDSQSSLQRFRSDAGGALALSLQLERLDRPATHELVKDLLGDRNIPTEFLDAIHSRSCGNPFAAGEYVRATLDAGLIRPSWDRWILDNQQFEKLVLPTDVIQLVVKRLENLSPETLALLRFAAVMGSPFSPSVLRQAYGSSGNEIQGALSEAVGANLLERTELGSFTFIHDRVQEALLVGLGPEDLKASHRRIADAIAAQPSLESAEIYSLAHHLFQGRDERNIGRVLDANRAAGFEAMKNFAIEDAYKFLSRAYRLCEEGGWVPDFELEKALADVCRSLGRLSDSIMHFERALLVTQEPLLRAQLRGQVAQVRIANLQVDQAGQEIAAAFSEIEREAPRHSIRQWLATVGNWVLYQLLSLLKIGFGRASGERRRELEVIAELYSNAGLINYYRFPLIQLQSAMRNLPILHQLGEHRITVIGFSDYGVGMAILQLSRSARRYLESSMVIARRLGSPQSIAHSAAWNGLRAAFLAEKTEVATLSALLEEHRRWILIEDLVNTSGCLIWALTIRGYSDATLKWCANALDRLQSVGQKAQSHSSSWFHSFSASALALAGQRKESLNAVRDYEALGIEVPFHQGLHFANMLLIYLIQGEFGAPAERIIETFREFDYGGLTTPFHIRLFYVSHAHFRLAQYMSADEGQRKAILPLLKGAARELHRMAIVPTFAAHSKLIHGAIARIEGRTKRALRSLMEAESIAFDYDMPWIHLEVARERARHFLMVDRAVAAQHEAQIALSTALRLGWTQAASQIRAEFAIDRGSVLSPSFGGTESVNFASVSLEKHLRALLELNLVSGSVLDPDAHAKITLKHIIKVLGAERAMLFLCDGPDGEAKFKVGMTSSETVLESAADFSSKTVEWVHARKAPVVLNGPEQGDIASESMILHDLRSIIAAPLLIRDRLLGIVYLDSRFSKGIFTSDDVAILTALANQIAIGLETAQKARLEVDRQALEKDLEVTRAVQKLLLPAEDHFKSGAFEIVSYYLPAQRAGGDWWSWHRSEDGSLTILLGDVTGHGPGSAMIVAAIAGSYRTILGLSSQIRGAALMEMLNTNLMRLSRDEYSMTLAIAQFGDQPGTIELLNAGAPPVWILRSRKPESPFETVILSSAPLGLPGLSEFGSRKITLDPGDRVFMFTDGAIDLAQSQGKTILRAAFLESAKLDLKAARAHLASTLDKMRGGAQPNDDITFLLLQYKLAP